MARIRTIKPEFPQSESMGRVSRDARLCFIMIWTICDDAGRVRGNSRMLASLLYPYDDDAPRLMEGWLSELEQEGCIRRYQIGTDTYLESINWLKHQKIDKPSPSRLPHPPETSRNLAKPREQSARDLVPSTLDQDLGSGTTTTEIAVVEDFEVFFEKMPRKTNKLAARTAFVQAAGNISPATLIAAAGLYSGSVRGFEDRYILSPAKWLTDKRWEDFPKVGANGKSAFHSPEETANQAALKEMYRDKA